MKLKMIFSASLRWARDLGVRTATQIRSRRTEKRNLAELAKLNAALLQDIALSVAARNAIVHGRQLRTTSRFEYWTLFGVARTGFALQS